MGGSGFGPFVPGERITDVATVKVGDILTEHSKQFDAKNVMRVTRVDVDRGLFYAVFVNPENTAEKRQPLDEDFVLWDFDIETDYGVHRAKERAT